MQLRKYFLLFLLSHSIASVAAPPTGEGKEIFTARCAACHNINKVLTGPALGGLHERRSMEWIVSFVKSSQSMIKNGDKDAVAVFEQFNKIPMPDHPDLTDEHIASIVGYIKEASAATETAPFAKPEKLRPANTPLNLQEDYAFFIAFFAMVGLLVVALLFAVQVQQYNRIMRGNHE